MHASDEEALHEITEEMSSWHFAGEHHAHAIDDLDSLPHRGGAPGSQGSQGKKKRRQSLFTRLPEGVQGVFEPTITPSRQMAQSMIYEDSRNNVKNAHRLTVDELSAKYMVPIRRGIVSMFLTRDGES
jgi:hypothetical protein